MAVSQAQLQQLYLAYFGRPADFDGLVYYTSRAELSIWDVAASFSASPESQALYGAGFNASVINNIYINLFNREAEPAGLLYWSQEVASGRLSPAGAALGILLGAQNDDLVSVNNKLTVAAEFTAAMDSAEEIIAYSGNVAAGLARAFLATVTSDTATVTTAIAALENPITGIVVPTPPPPAGQTFTLTANTDVFNGGAGADTFVANVAATTTDWGLTYVDTLQSIDTLNGGAGVDTLKIMTTGNVQLPTLTSVENIEVRGLDEWTDVSIDTSSTTGVTNLIITKADDVDVTAGDSTAVSVSGATDDIYIDGGASQTVVAEGGDNQYYELYGSKGAVSLTVADQGDDVDIWIENGTDVTVITTTSATGWEDTGYIAVGGWGDGDAATDPTGTVTIVQNLHNDGKTAGTLWGEYIAVDGGTTVSVSSNVTTAASTTVSTSVEQSDVEIYGGATQTSVSVFQTAAVAAVAGQAAVAGVKETQTVTFGAMASAETLTINGLTFTAAKALTATDVASAFANLANGATQGFAPAANGIYSGTFSTIAGSTGSVTTSGTINTVTFTSTAEADVAALTIGGTATGTSVTATVDGSAATAAIQGVVGVATGSVTINGAITGADVLAAVNLAAYGAGSTITSDALTTLAISQSNEDLTVTNAAATILNLGVNKIGTSTSDTDIDVGSTYTTVNVFATGAASNIDLHATGATALNISGDQALTLSGSTFGALETVTISGSGGVTTTDGFVDATLTSIDASASSGRNELRVDASLATYVGGSGIDVVRLHSATVSKAVAMGAGDDHLVLATGTTSLGANVSGGDGTDTLWMAAADAEAASATDVFETKVDGFERLGLGTVAASTSVTVDLANLDDISYVTMRGYDDAAAALTLTDMANGGTLDMAWNNVGNASTAGTATVTMTDATGTADSLNVVARISTANKDFGTVAAAGVESINLSVLDSAATTTLGGVQTATVSISDAALKTLNVTGNANLVLTTNSVVLTSVDGSAMTGKLTAGTNGTVAQTITGGSAADTLTANGNGDTLIGGAGGDALVVAGNLVTLAGGAGADTFNVGFAVSNVNSYATITDLAAGDKIKFSSVAANFMQSKVVLGDTAVFQDYANAAMALSADGEVSWFQFGGNTYVVEEVGGGVGNLFTNGEDIIVKVVGLVDLSTASFSSEFNTLLIV